MPRVVTCIMLNNEGEILVLKRGDKVRTYKGMWGGIAGYIEENENSYETALKEIFEETGLEKRDVSLVRQLEPFIFTDFYDGKKYDWEVFPFLFKTEKKSKVHIDWEHSEYRWIAPSKIKNMNTVPHLKDIVFRFFCY